MSKMKYVKDFDFKEKACNYEMGGKVKGYSEGGTVWAAEKRKTAQKNGKTTVDEYEQVSFDDAGNYLKKKQTADGEVSTDFKKLPKVQSGSAFQAETEAKGMQKGGSVKGKTMVKALRRSVPVAPTGPMIAVKKGGAVPKAGAFKIPKVMSEFKEGKLHSGSKTGPEVTNKKQAMAIALSEARQAGKR